MQEVHLLWFLSLSMLVCSFLSGMVPMALRLSDSKSRLLALMGSGILVGTALSIIIPEGVNSLYKDQREPIASQPTRDSAHKIEVNDGDKKHAGNDHHEKLNTATTPQPMAHSMQSLLQNADPNMTWTIGMSLIVGFVLMLLIEQFSIYQSGVSGHHHHNHSHPSEIHTNPVQGDYTLACLDDDTDIGLEEDGDDRTILFDKTMTTSSETRPIRDSDSHGIVMLRSSTNESNNTNSNTSATKNSPNANPNRYYDHSRHLVGHRAKKNPKVTPTLGLVIHAAADGIALGAAATTSHRDVEMIIFLAIMLHKAPAAFSLVVLLLHNGLRPPTIRKHLLAFSLSAPIAAVLTYYGLSQQGKEALRRNNATGVAMLFSAGTFLFVATVHVLPELIQNKLLTPKEMLFLLGGSFLPLLLAQTI